MVTTSPTLLNRLRQPDPQRGYPTEAWERFVLLYTPLLLHWARQQGLQDADAEDLVQEVLVKLLRELPAYQQQAGQSFRSWLFRVSVNQCRDYRRRKATRVLPAADGLSEVADHSPIPDLEEAEYRRLLVRRGLELIRRDFSEATWSAFTQVMLDGRSPAEVAEELQLSINAVYLARHRVLTRLRQELDGLLE
jgi:RNA polymerase sigma-70 factor (ECF subfamily)